MNDASWDDLRLFLHVAREGGLAGAAARTGISAPTIGRRMLALERSTGRSLFVRQQTGYSLASDGRVLFERVRQMETAAHTIAEWRDDVLALPIVRVSADLWMSGFIGERLRQIWTPDDAFRMCFKTGDPREAISHRAADIGLCDRRPGAGNVAVRRSVSVAYAVYCARDFDLETSCNWVSLGTDVAASPPARWIFEQPRPWITVWANTPPMLLSLIRGGAGRGVLPCFVGDADPQLMRAGPLLPELGHDAYILMHDDERRRPETRTVIDRLAGLLEGARDLFAGSEGE